MGTVPPQAAATSKEAALRHRRSSRHTSLMLMAMNMPAADAVQLACTAALSIRDVHVLVAYATRQHGTLCVRAAAVWLSGANEGASRMRHAHL